MHRQGAWWETVHVVFSLYRQQCGTRIIPARWTFDGSHKELIT